MKKRLGAKLLFIVQVAAVALSPLLLSAHVSAATVSTSIDFNSVSDLTNYFNGDGATEFTNISNGGINDSGSVDVPIPSNDIWTTKQGYTVTGNAGSVYTFSAYFKIAQNSGWGNLGFTDEATNTPDGIGQPATGLGANFHGGGGSFVNNGVETILSWPPDLVLGDWYWMTFQVTAKGSNTFDLKLQIWNTDSTGTIGVMKTEKTMDGVVNTDLGSATTIHAFFSAAGSRMEKIDNFGVDLVGATVVEQDRPVILAGDPVSKITASSATSGGNITDDQGFAITARGVCWSTTPAPTLSDKCTNDGTGTGSFSSALTGLLPNTTYYLRAYATNSKGTTYAAEESFKTLAAQVVPGAPNTGMRYQNELLPLALIFIGATMVVGKRYVRKN